MPIADRKTLDEHLAALLTSLDLDMTTRARGCGYTDITLWGTRDSIATLGRIMKRSGFAHTVTHHELFTTLIVRYVWTNPESLK